MQIKTLEFKSELKYQINSSYEIQSGISYQNINYKQKLHDLWTYIGDRRNTNPTIKDTLVTQGIFGDEEPVNIQSYKYSAYLENIILPTNSLIIILAEELTISTLTKT